MDQSSSPPAGRVALQPRLEELGLSRRQLLRLAAAVSALGLAGLACDLSSVASVIQNRPVRRDITSAAAQKDINTYKTAITKMQALPMSDPRNWTNQASIHFNHCRHSSWLFFPWHRAYLYYFEQICQELTGDTTFGLPYWNWTTSPQIPAVFWDTSSPLYYNPTPSPPLIGPRIATSSSVADSSFVGPAVISSELAEPNFLVFAGAATTLNDTSLFGPGYGLVEQTPHNYIHGFVGGTMGAFMSPLDPLFWTHHCRVDELWVEWNILKNNPNTNDSNWTDTEFDEFCDGKGNPVAVKVIVTVLMPLLSYQYDTQCGC